MHKYLWPYRWQISLLPFFAVSIWLALSLDVAGDRTEFVTISVLYAFADVLMVNYFVAGDARGRALGFHRTMDTLGAIAGPLLGVGLLGWAPRRLSSLVATVGAQGG